MFCCTNSTLTLHSLSRHRQSLGREKFSRRKHKDLLLMILEGPEAPWMSACCGLATIYEPFTWLPGERRRGKLSFGLITKVVGAPFIILCVLRLCFPPGFAPSCCCLDPMLQACSWPLTPVSHALWWGGGKLWCAISCGWSGYDKKEAVFMTRVIFFHF